MECSLEEAFSLFFAPWCNDGTELVLAVDKGGAERCHIIETSVGESYIRVRSDNLDAVLPLEGATLSYGDSRAGIVPTLVERKWACFLELRLPNGRLLLFAVPRQDSGG